jgi:glycosyltransferase involved in cell wall biosynthesis
MEFGNMSNHPPPRKKTAVVITPTMNSFKLQDTISSVLKQDYNGPFHHLIVSDDPTNPAFIKTDDQRIVPITLPWNTGRDQGSFYGHRVFAGFAHLVPHDYILLLDEDNWIEPNHVSSLVNACENNGWDWCHSLRKIYDETGTYICEDNCESLGKWPIFMDMNAHLVDTSSYCFKKDFLIKVASNWHSGWGGDRRFLHIVTKVMGHTNWGCSGEYTLCYRLDGNPNSVNKDFFINGNKVMEQKYEGKFPWKQQISSSRFQIPTLIIT